MMAATEPRRSDFVRRALLIQALMLSAFLCMPFLSSTAETNREYQQGTLLELNVEFPCAHECGPFETDFFSFCVQSGDTIFLARLFDTRFNYDPNKLHAMVGKTIQFRTGQENLWIVRPDGREFRIKQNYTSGDYSDTRCVAELHRHILQDHPEPKTPQCGAAPQAVYVPLTAKVGYWTWCVLALDRAIVCYARGTKGEEFSHLYQPLPGVLSNSDLKVDPLRTRYDSIVLSSGESLVRK